MSNDVELDFGNLDDFSLDVDFTLEGDGTSKPVTKRGIIKEFTAGVLTGMGASLRSGGVKKNLLKSILPATYTPAFDTIDRLGRFGSDLYDKVKVNTRDSVNEVKSTVGEALSIHGSKLPERVLKSLDEWAKTSTEDYSYTYDSSDKIVDDTDEVSRTLSESAVYQAALADAHHREEMATMVAVSDRAMSVQADTNVLLGALHRQTSRLVGYNEQITADFQRKSLELQLRQYKLSVAAAKMQEGFYTNALKGLEVITKNTGLPEIVKATEHEKTTKILSRTLFGTTSKGASKYGSHLLDSLYDMADQKSMDAGGKLNTSAMLARMMLSGASSVGQGNRLGARTIGSVAGSGLMAAAPWLASRYLRPMVAKRTGIKGAGSNMSYYADNMPGLLNRWLKERGSLSEDFDPNDENNKFYSKMQKKLLNPFLNNMLFKMPTTQGNRAKLHNQGIKDLAAPVQWDVLSRRTLIEVIPGLLTRQLTSLEKARTGRDDIQDIEYSHKRGAFTSSREAARDVVSSVFKRNEFQSAAGNVNSMVEALDPEGVLSADARVALAMRFAKDADAGDGFEINSYLKASGWGGASKKTVREIQGHLKDRFKVTKATGMAAKFGKYQIGKDEDTAKLRMDIASSLQTQSRYTPDIEETVNVLAGSGQRSKLKEIGLIKRVNGQDVINHDMYWEMMERYIKDPNYRPDLELGDDVSSKLFPPKSKVGKGNVGGLGGAPKQDGADSPPDTTSSLSGISEALGSRGSVSAGSVDDAVARVKAELARSGVSQETIQQRSDEIRAVVVSTRETAPKTGIKAVLGKVRSRLKIQGGRGSEFNAKDFFKDKSDGLFGRNESTTSGPTKGELGLSRQEAILTQIYRSLNRREEGDGTAEGNKWSDILKRRKGSKEDHKEAEAQMDGSAKEKPKSIFGMLGSLVGMVGSAFAAVKKFGILGSLANFLGLGWVGDLVGGLGSLLTGKRFMDAGMDLLDGDGGDRRRRRRGGGRRGGRGGLLRRGARGVGNHLGNIGKGIGRRTAGFARNPAKGAMRMVKGAGVLSVGMAAFDMYDSYQEGDYKGVAEAAGGGLGGALGGAMAGAAIGSVVPIVGTFIGGLIGGAIGYFAGSSAAGALYDLIKDPGLLTKMRLYQYGLQTTDQRRIEAIIKTEAFLEQYVKVSEKGFASLDPNVPLGEIAGLYITDPDDEDMIDEWATWFLQRFKPVYLTHMALSKEMFPDKKLHEIDDSKDWATKYEFARRAQMFDQTNDHPYRITGRIFEDTEAIDFKTTTALVKEIVDELKAKSKSMSATTASTSSFITGNDSQFEKKEVDEEVLKAIDPDGTRAGLNTKGHIETTWYGSERTVVSAKDMLKDILPDKDKPLDDFTAARMKIYGLPNLDIVRIQSILQLELVMTNKIKYTSNGALYDGDPAEIFKLAASIFQIADSSWSFKRWNIWFSKRFLPVFVTFVGKMHSASSTTTPIVDAKLTSADIALDILTAMTAVMTKDDNDAEVSVWSITESPWPYFKSNTEAALIEGHLTNLRTRIKEREYQAMPQNRNSEAQKAARGDWEKQEDGTLTSSQIATRSGDTYDSQRMQTQFNPTTGRMEVTYKGASATSLGGANGTASTGAVTPAIDMTGTVGPLVMGPGTEEGARTLIREAMKMGITDKTELAMLLAQTHNETGGYKVMEENLKYRAETLMKLWPHRFPTLASAQALAQGGPVAIANSIYGNRMGNVAPGDGWKYRGRGYIQLTGKGNYAALGKVLGVDLVNNPDLVATDPSIAARTAVAFWTTRPKLRAASQAGDMVKVTKIANGGAIGIENRTKLFKQYMQTMAEGKFDDMLSGKAPAVEGGDGPASPAPEIAEGSATSTAPVEDTSSLSATLSKGVNQSLQAGERVPQGADGTPQLGRSQAPSAAAKDNATSAAPGALNSTASTESATTTPTPAVPPSGSVKPSAAPKGVDGAEAALNKTQIQSQQQTTQQPAVQQAPTASVKPSAAAKQEQASAVGTETANGHLATIAGLMGELVELYKRGMNQPGRPGPGPVQGANGNTVSMRTGK